MEIRSKSKSGEAVRLFVDRDRYGVYQVYADFMTPATTPGERCLCHGWGAWKTGQGMMEGIFAEGRVIEVPKKDWNSIVAAREELRNRDHLEDIHLVKVFFQGDRLSVDSYTLSAPVDRETWKRIESCMCFVDSADNDTLLAGDRFVGWVVKGGLEAEVERILGVQPDRLIDRETKAES